MTSDHKLSKNKSLILKISLFATGLSGIVAEYILSTLATYFLGDSILQWTLILSFMLFSMGLGSRISRYFEGALLEKFIFIEFILSLLVGFVAILVYIVSGYTQLYYSQLYNGMLIYALSIVIGVLIGMEIPLVTRLNQEYETLRVNISSVMENDYYGSLLGGLFFAFVGLPYLGMTYTPFVLGFVNFLVALVLFLRFRRLIQKRILPFLSVAAIILFLALSLGLCFAKPIIRFAEQKGYKDKVLYSEQSKYQRIVITQLYSDYWLYLNNSQQFSTRDEALYHEPLVHPVMTFAKNPQQVLVLGGGDGVAAKEILKYNSVKSITLVDLDPAVTDLAKTHPVLLEANDSSFYNPKVKIRNKDAFHFVANDRSYYDVIVIDLPDPKTPDLGRMYSKEFYSLCRQRLRPQGLVITQAGSPYYTSRAYECINKSMQAADFQTLKLHNQVITMGEWGWVVGHKTLSTKKLRKAFRRLEFRVKTRWIDSEAMKLITSFGKDKYFFIDEKKVEVNTIHNPVLYQYYLQGTWDW